MIKNALIAFFISFIFSSTIIFLSRKKFSKLITDHLHVGPQKFHLYPTPRLGGLSIFFAYFLIALIVLLKGETYKWEFFLIGVASLPAFFGGLFEDLRGKLGAKLRFILICLSATLAFFILDAKIVRVDLPFDIVFSFWLISYLFTVFALTGLTNSINIIDGFNGLASMVSIIIFLAIGYVSYKLGEYSLATLCVTMAGALAGFFILNYPNGLIFLGDGGAYFTGFLIGTISVLLIKRHSEVSAWFPFLVCIYPIVESIFSIYRRKVIKKVSPFLPDALHLHTLIYKRLTKWLLGPQADKVKRNAATSPFLWMLCLLGIVPALFFWDRPLTLIFFSFFFVIFYLYLYWKILMPKWLKEKRQNR